MRTSLPKPPAFRTHLREEGNDNPLQDSWLENPMDRGAWQAIVHGVAKSQTRLSDYTHTHTHTHTHTREEVPSEETEMSWPKK